MVGLDLGVVMSLSKPGSAQKDLDTPPTNVFCL
jgi:hypothetical protein